MRTLIRDVRVFDGERAVASADILIDGDLIAEPDGHGADVELDGAGKTLLPGLIDAHTHTFDGSLARALTYGVTTELDMFCLPSNLRRQRKLAAERDDVADLRSAGVLATAPGGHPTGVMAAIATLLDNPEDAAGAFETITDPAQAASFVAARAAEGSDYLKIVIDDGAMSGTAMPTLGRDIATALADAARAVGLKTLAHACTARETALALDAGVDGLAHVWADTPPADPATDTLAARLADQGVFVVSTLAYFESIGGANQERLANASHVADVLRRADVPLLAGTDANPFAPRNGDGLHRELELLVQAGLSPLEALAAGTSVTARHFGLSDRGRIAPGLRADLLLVDGDPTRDITTSRAIADIWRQGVRQPGTRQSS